MGCGGSTMDSPNNSMASLNAPSEHRASSENLRKNASSSDNLRKQVLKKQQDADVDSLNSEPRPGSRSTCRDSGIDSAKTADGRRHHSANETAHGPVDGNNAAGDNKTAAKEGNKGGVAFEVEVSVNNNADSIIKKHPPKRLQMFDPTAEPPRLTAEMLAEKQRLADERRKQELMNRTKSGKKTSKRRRDLLAAKEFGNQEQQQKLSLQLDDKITSADRNREKRQAEIKAKQKQRELRAQRARERVKRLDDEEGEELNFDLEKDDAFNEDDDVDSWLDGENGSQTIHGSATTTTSERIYDGRSSPSKRFQPLTSAETRRKQAGLGSAVSDEITNNNRWADQTQDNDDFFDT